MRLNMWMIANRLAGLEAELQIRSHDAPLLMSARNAYATNCVHVYQDGPDCVCNGEGDIIRIKNMDEKQAFEIIQGIFDFYRSWQTNVCQALAAGQYGEFIALCGNVFGNPVILQDANNKVLAISAEYAQDALDEEWAYLNEFHYSSIKSINYLRSFSDQAPLRRRGEPRLLRFPKSADRLDCLSIDIFQHGIFYGRITVLEKDRPLNPGDSQVIKYLAEFLSTYLPDRNGQDDVSNSHSIFLDVVMGYRVEERRLEQQMRYLGWEHDHFYRLITFSGFDERISDDFLYMISQLLISKLPHAAVFTNDTNVIAIVNENLSQASQAAEMIEQVAKNNDLRAGASFAAKGLDCFPILYHQARAAVRYGISLDPQVYLYFFRSYTIDYLLEISAAQDTEKALYACHPDVVEMWLRDQERWGNQIETLWVYLNNDRSLINTANELYVHRSTLVYRIKKITEALHGDITDAYTRDYIKLSIRFLRLFGDKIESFPTLRL